MIGYKKHCSVNDKVLSRLTERERERERETTSLMHLEIRNTLDVSEAWV
jgi:hypothetical protein